MRKFPALAGAIVAVIAASVVPGSHLSTVVSAVGTVSDGTPAQKYLDIAADKDTYAGLWGDVTGGAAGRPYVTELSVTVRPADGSAAVSRTYITGGTVTTPASTTPGDITATIAPYNVCNKAKGEQPAAGRCYSDPNRLGVLIGYVMGENNVGFNFSSPATEQGTPITGQMLDLIKNPANTTEFDVTFNMNSWGKSLRWTWMNGLPTYWNVNPVGENNSTVHLKFLLQSGPSELCDTRIPVEGCDPTQRGSNFAPVSILRTNFVLSLDSTGVEQMFAGSLFASANADMGSLEAVPVGSPTLGLTYGVTGSSELGGQPNVASFWAFVSDYSLVNYFGTTQETLDAPEFAGSETLKVTRADGGSSESTSWARWTADANGTSGYFLTVTGVKFDGTSVASQSVRGSAMKASKPAKWKMGNKSSNSVSIRRSGARQVLVMSSTNSACKKYSCRWVVSRSSSKVKTTMKRLAIVPTPRGSGRATASVSATKGTLVSAQLQAKKSGKWVYVTSRMMVAK